MGVVTADTAAEGQATRRFEADPDDHAAGDTVRLDPEIARVGWLATEGTTGTNVNCCEAE